MPRLPSVSGVESHVVRDQLLKQSATRGGTPGEKLKRRQAAALQRVGCLSKAEDVVKKLLKSVLGTIILIAAYEPVRVFGQTSDIKVISVDTTSPYEIANWVNRSRRKWERNNVLEDIYLGLTWKRFGIDPGDFENCSGYCNAQVFVTELNGLSGPEAILKLTRSFDFCRFVVFTRRKGDWKFLGHIDHDFNRYRMASHRIAHFTGRSWLLIRGQEGSGSGFSLYGETWYEIGWKSIRPVLSYPVAGNTFPWPSGLGREFEAQVLRASKTTAVRRELVIRYVVRYSKLDYINNNFSKLLVNEHRTHYAWDNKSSAFIFEPSHSNISQGDIDAIANIEPERETPAATIGNTNFYSANQSKAFVGGGYEVFLKYNLNSLMKIANDKDNDQREWLLSFLNDCNDVPEKRSLLQALHKTPVAK